MNKNKIKNLLEFACLLLVLSYFFIHNIFFVAIGILLSIYLINVHRIEKLKAYININSCNIDLTKNFKNNVVSKESKHVKKDISNKDSNLKLVEIVEESGFIPSIDKRKDINAA